MSKINDLIYQLCPEGVEFKALGEVTIWDKKFKEVEKQAKKIKFKHISAAALKSLKRENGTIKLLSTGNFDGFTTQDLAKDLINEDEVISLPSGGVANIKYYNGKFVDSGNLLAVSADNKTINLKFIYYFLISKREIVENFYRGAGVKHPNMREIFNLKIPIPPLEIQKEVVLILDAFTELQAELQARKKQYEFYREKLLSIEALEKRAEGQGVKMMSLGEIGKVSMCKRIFKNQTKATGDIPFYTIGTFGGTPSSSFIDKSLFEDFKRKYSYPKKGDVLISASGTIGKVVIYDGKESYYQDSNIVWIDNNENLVTNKFLFYIYKNTKWKNYFSKGGTIARLYNDNLKKIKIPIPPLKVQNEVVEILDQFDALVSDICIGLPAEMTARKKQYAFYREKLLTFKELKK